ncbi:MAG TPA: DsbA family protein [Polyangiaceae bacterium]
MCARRISILWLVGCLSAAACQPPGVNDASQAAAAGDGLPGVDTSSLTRAERDVWAELVTEQLAPCSTVPKSIADCVRQNAACEACKPAAEQMAQQIRRGKTKSQAEQAFRLRFTDTGLVTVDVDGSPSKGPANAPVTIVEWADFECGFCGRAAPLFDEMTAAYPTAVHFVFKHFPLDMHLHGKAMAELAVAASLQGKFWEMHHALFAGKGTNLDEPSIQKLALELQLDAAKLIADMKSPEVADRIARDKSQADKLGLKGTPFILINGRHFDSSMFNLEEDLRTWIDVELTLTKTARRP